MMILLKGWTNGKEKLVEPVVTYRGPLDLQVCVPKDWTDEQVVEFAQIAVLCGTSAGWQIVREGSEFLSGDKERVACLKRKNFVHVMLAA